MTSRGQPLAGFERELCVTREELSLGWVGTDLLAWCDFYLNPRRLRGSDFLMRWSQGVWSEERITEAVNETGRFKCLPYGPSGTAPDHDVQEFERYFERLDHAGLARLKRPDLLVFPAKVWLEVEELIQSVGGVEELPFTSEEDPRMRELLSRSVLAVECENSLWRASLMPDFGTEMKPQKRLNGMLGTKKSAVLPTVIIKEEDLSKLRGWQQQSGVPIHIWHNFFDLAYGISLYRALELISSGQIQGQRQVFQAPGGATTIKTIYKINYHHAYPLGHSVEEPKLSARAITDKNGHILPYVAFEGGKMVLSEEALKVLEAHAS